MAKKTITQQTQTLDGHSGLGDKPNINDGLSATQLKTRYDRDVNRNKDYLNSTLIAELQAETAGTAGAYAIGYDGTDKNVGDMLTTIIAAGSGSIPPDGTVTNAKLATDVKVGSLGSLTTTAKADVVSAINEVDAKTILEQYEEADTLVTNNTGTYQTTATLTVATSGTYIIHYTLQHWISTTQRYGEARLVLNDTTELALDRTITNLDPNYGTMAGVKKYTLSATDTLKLQFRMESADVGEQSSSQDSRIFIQEYTGS